MANPARGYDDPQNPVGNQPSADRPSTENVQPVRQERGMGTSVFIAAIVLVLAVIAYFVFGPNRTQTTTTANPPAATEPAPAPAAPSTSKPSAPSTTTPSAPAPSATQPAAPAEPAKPAPAQPAPAQPAPAQ